MRMRIYRLCVPMLTVLLMAVEATAQLPPDIQADRYLIQAERHIGTGDYTAAKATLDRILELQAEHDLALPEAFWFKHAQVSHQAGDHAEAVESVTRYLTTAGCEGAHYREALELLDRAEAEAEVEAERQAAERRAAEIRRVLNEMEFVLIEPGTFEMGSPETEAWRVSDERLHRVMLSQPFYLGKYEVTQGQWQAVMGSNPSLFACGATCPVENVSWEDTQAFIAALNRQEGVEKYRLPTEAEWEYAARAGTQTAYHFGDDASQLGAYAWYGDNVDYENLIHPVGQKRPNAWGLYDMHGNVQEWVQDWYGGYPHGAVTDPRGPSSGARRVDRGGSWFNSARQCRAADRGDSSPGYRNGDLGFRLARIS
ncbi:MAG: formylglycine-generating enzyme family protein [Desulfurellaceae bacterium]|nr:formylglycine-generating enzyme family protein [Desulfurellaceae bacterium]